ncbi:hypothetical protein EDD15DRAFT_2361976 [Pisolithus albus]|nr:hypothetical protein EDD15DRAFT_2361976 [Pisolithus albus]
MGYDNRFRPLSFHFYDWGSKGIAAYLNHGVIAWDLQNRTPIWQIEPTPASPQIASSVLLHHPGLLAVKGMHADVCVYNLGESHHSSHFTLPHEPDWCYPTSLAFVLGNALVCGTNSGKVVIWAPGKKKVMQVLDQKGLDIIQAVALLGPPRKGVQRIFLSGRQCNTNNLKTVIGHSLTDRELRMWELS